MSIAAADLAAAQSICTYTDWAWNSAEGRAEDYRSVQTSREALSPTQSHPELPCSICREDQLDIRLSNGAELTVCRVIAARVETALEDAISQGFPIRTVTGYRVGRTRGPLDARGLRTEYSNHSFGLAVDINAEANGLYDRCVVWSASCRLRRGGAWRPGDDPHSISEGDPLHRAMAEDARMKWGGALVGQQKDYMHFSLTGD